MGFDYSGRLGIVLDDIRQHLYGKTRVSFVLIIYCVLADVRLALAFGGGGVYMAIVH